MYRILMTTIVLLTVRLYAQGQERVTPRVSKGGEKQGEPWAEVPESFRNVKIPERPLPTDLERWQKVDHAKIRATLPKCLGEMPVRPDPSKVRAVSKADRGDYFQERFEFDNGVDMTVPGLLLIPKNRKGPAPAVIVLHGHGSSIWSGREALPPLKGHTGGVYSVAFSPDGKRLASASIEEVQQFASPLLARLVVLPVDFPPGGRFRCPRQLRPPGNGLGARVWPRSSAPLA